MTTPPRLLAQAQAHLAGRLPRAELEAAVAAWNRDHPEAPQHLDHLLALAAQADGPTRVAPQPQAAPPAEEATRVAPRPQAPPPSDAADRPPPSTEPPPTEVAGIEPPPEGTAPTEVADQPPTLAAASTLVATTPPDLGEVRELHPGDRLKERFVLESLIGRGGMGAVFKALDLRKQEARDRDPYVAVKVLAGNFREHPAAFIALQREAKKAQQLAHPNTVTVYDFDRDGPIVYMTMELLKGQSLKELLQKHPYGMPFKEVLPLVEDIVSGLAYAHKKGIVHSDLKPGNLFVTKEGTVKVLDFGIARALHGSPRSEGGELETTTTLTGFDRQETLFDPGTLGALTPAYASCEMFEGQDPDPRDDVYALACVTYELLTGRHPFHRLPAPKARAGRLTPDPIPKIPRRAWRALQHGLAFERAARTPSVKQFFIELSGRRPGQGINPRIAAAIVLVVLGAGVGLTLHFQPQLEYYWHQLFPTELPPETRAEIAELLELADLNRETGRLLSPPGSNAYEAYQAVLQLDPWNRQAREGLEKIADYLIAEANRLNSTEQKKQALALVDESLQFFPDNKTLRWLRRRLEAETR